MSLKEYALKFTQLFYNTPELVSNMKAQISKFVSGLSNDLILGSKEAILNNDMDIS